MPRPLPSDEPVIVVGPSRTLRERIARRIAVETGRRWMTVSVGRDCRAAAHHVAESVARADGTPLVVAAPSCLRPSDLRETLVVDADLLVVAAVSARTALADLTDGAWREAGDGEGLVAETSVLAEQLEGADSVVLDPARGHERTRVALAVIGHLAPDAQLVVESARPLAIRRAAHEAPTAGWVRLLNQEHEPGFRDPRVSSFRYEQPLPFHPRRLASLLREDWTAGRFGTVIRSAGFCRLASRPGITGWWDQAGTMISIEPARADGDDQLAIGQDLGITGIDLDARAIVRALDGCVLTATEFAAGPELWRRLVDPLPAWVTAA